MLFNALKDRDALKRKAHLIDVLAAHPIEIEVHMPRSDGAFQYYGRSPRDHAAWNWNFFAERSDSPLEVLEAWARCVDAEGGK